MTNAYEIKKVMELVELIKETVGIDGIDAFKLLQQWTSEDSKESKVSIDPINHKWDKAFMVKGGYIVNKEDTENLLKSAKKAEEAIFKNWTDYIAKIESENPVEIKKDFNIKTIPLQLLTKVNNETSNKEIDSILSTIRSIEYIGFYDTSNEGRELSRIETLLEDRIIADMNDGNYKSLENSVRLLQKIKGSYRTVITSGTLSGGTIK